MKIPFINIADVNCWIVYLMPVSFEEKGNINLIKEIQSKCIEHRCFGMGWDVDISNFGCSTMLTDETASNYLHAYGNDMSLEKSLESYKKIKKGDFVIFRGKNSHFYVGRVSKEAYYLHFNEIDPVFSNFSWGCDVDEWVEYSLEQEIPSEVVGRFSQRRHSTIQRIDTYRLRLLIIAMYDNKASIPSEYNIPRVGITKDNFVRSLNYMELEDLVAAYISRKHKDEGYFLLPSSCKVCQQNYEFTFVSKRFAPITCQVKNQQSIEVKDYVNERQYRIIYIFSGIWNDIEVEKLKKEYDEEHLYIISPTELYESLSVINIFNNPFYTFNELVISNDDLENLLKNNAKFIKTSKDKPNNVNEYSITVDSNLQKWICFYKGSNLFFSEEFGSLILSYHILPDDSREEEMQNINWIVNQLDTDNKVDREG